MAEQVTDENFELEVLQADKPVLVDFWAPWCPPCRQMSPIVDELAEDLKDSYKVVKVNVDEAQASAARYGVHSIPTFLVFHGGRAQAQHVGLVGKQRLREALESASLKSA